MFNTSLIRDKIIEAALKCAEETPWSDVTMRDVAEKASVSLNDLYQEFQSKRSILTQFARHIDKAVLTQADAAQNILEEVARDRIFDVLMTRFEVMQPYKAAIKAIINDMRQTRDLSDICLSQMYGSQRWMLNAAAITSEGTMGRIRVVGISKIYLDVFRIWLEDDDPGLAKTMAALDKKLRRGEAWVKRADTVVSESRALFNRLFRQQKDKSVKTQEPSIASPPNEPTPYET